MIDRIQEIEQGLKVWRAIILVLTIVILIVSILGNNQMSIIVLIICFFALILFQLKTLPSTSYQVPFHSLSFLFYFNLRTWSSFSGRSWETFI